MSAPEVSHGRGGAGNINPDSTQYVDGEITRQGDEGTQNAGPYSTGRGGGGNIGEPGKEPGLRTDKDVVPDVATRKSEEEPFHTGRGGAANVQLADDEEGSKKKAADSSLPAAKQQTSTADKLKHKIFGMFKK
ncbi:GTP1/OBG domain-containing protein [Apiospora saccharicola]|uniref:GTP1/OBG domain-containing protein n=1 Tax=Apiospora saccharicola TaxID=335842 RepID=A0ABR1WGF6_9PEZI